MHLGAHIDDIDSDGKAFFKTHFQALDVAVDFDNRAMYAFYRVCEDCQPDYFDQDEDAALLLLAGIAHKNNFSFGVAHPDSHEHEQDDLAKTAFDAHTSTH